MPSPLRAALLRALHPAACALAVSRRGPSAVRVCATAPTAVADRRAIIATADACRSGAFTSRSPFLVRLPRCRTLAKPFFFFFPEMRELVAHQPPL